MVIKPKTRGFICTTAHPEGCAANVAEAARQAAGLPGKGPGSVLVIGASTGYGLACRVAAAFGYGAATVGVSFEKPASGGRTASAGWYNTAAFDKLAAEKGLVCESINGDAFSDEIKAQTIEAIKSRIPGGQVELVIYSLASPRRIDPRAGVTWSSVIKPVGEAFQSNTIDFHSGEVSAVTVQPASPEEIEGTVKVMGGEDWLWWIQALEQAGVLAPGALTLAFSYIGPSQTHAVYKDGTIGRAKEDLEQKAREITALLAPKGGRGIVSVNKGLVTQASSAIPVVPLYISILYRVMKKLGVHEDCTAQMLRMFRLIYAEPAGGDLSKLPLDEDGRIRMDDWEMREDVQREVLELWEKVETSNVGETTDLPGYREDFFRLFGFGLPGIDYDADVEP